MTNDLPEEWFRPARQPEDAPTSYVPRAPQPGDAAAPAGPPTVAQPPVAPAEPTPQRAHVPVVASADHVNGDWRPWQPPQSRPSWAARHPGLLTALVLALALVVGVSSGLLIMRGKSGGQATAVTSAEPTTTASREASATPATPTTTAPQKPWSGDTRRIQATTATATCTAPAAKDDQGREVTYEASFVLDDDSTTAWRCAGDGVGESISFTFPAGTELVGVGVLNGYRKESGGEQLYPQYRRITSIRWTLADGAFFVQTLSDNDQGVQQVLTPPLKIDGPVKMTIEASSAPGSKEPSRDAVLVSTVSFYTKA